MGKKEQYYMLAERLYTEQRATLAKIAEKIDVSERTLTEWKKEGDWDTKRTNYLKQQYSCNTELYVLLQKMINRINSAYDNGEEPSKSELDFVKGIIDKIPKMKSFEDEQINKVQAEVTEEEKTPEDLSIKMAQAIRKHLTGR